MKLNDDAPVLEATPLEGVPGLSAAYYRCLYRLAMFQKRRLDRSAPKRAAYQADLDRQDQWSKEHSDPRADSMVNVFLWVLALVLVGLFFAPHQEGAGQTEMTPNAQALAKSPA